MPMLDAAVQERQFAQPAAQGLEGIDQLGKDLVVGLEGDRRARLFARGWADFLQAAHLDPALEIH